MLKYHTPTRTQLVAEYGAYFVAREGLQIEQEFYERFKQRVQKLHHIPRRLRQRTISKIENINPKNAPKTFDEAEAFLDGFLQKCLNVRTDLTLNNDKLVEYAESKAQDYAQIINRLGNEAGYKFAKKSLEKIGIKAPSLERYELAPAVERIKCPIWWRRNLRIVFARGVENIERDAGLTHAKSGIYISDDSYHRWQQQQQRNETLINLLQAINTETGEVYDLRTLIDASVSNPVNRRNELMTRLRGAEEYAQQMGRVGMFYTLTCPSKYHKQIYIKRTNSKNAIVKENPKYQGFTPKQGGEYLQGVWAKARAKFKRLGISPLGFRVIEPHHDGTPHWHIMLFCEPEHEEQITEILRSYSFNDCPDEAGAKAHRFKAVKIDWSRGSACGYLAKYIAKAIDGYAVDYDLYGKDAKSGAQRIKAWASTHGFKQFASFGLPPVGVWRLLRKLANLAKKDNTLFLPKFKDIITYADEANYCEFIKEYSKIGGRIKLLKAQAQESITRYGDIAKDKVKGLIFDLVEIITNSDWNISKKSGDLSPAWTCVNNYTRDASRFARKLENYYEKVGYFERTG